MERRDRVPCEIWERFWRLTEDVEAGRSRCYFGKQMESIDSMREWLTMDRFDRRAVNHRLKQDVEKDQRRQPIQKG